MKSRIYLLSFFLFFAFALLTSTSVKAGNDAPDNYYSHYNSSNSSSLAVNYRVAFVELAIVVIGVIIVRNARIAINAKLGSTADESI